MANIITVSRMVLSIALIFTSPLSTSFFVLYSAAGLTDILDGAVARAANTKSKIGELLDSAADLLLLAVCFFKLISFLKLPSLVWASVLFTAILKLSVLLLNLKVKSIIIEHSIMNKITGVFVFGLPFFINSHHFLYYAITVSLLSLATVFSEIFGILKLISAKK